MSKNITEEEWNGGENSKHISSTKSYFESTNREGEGACHASAPTLEKSVSIENIFEQSKMTIRIERSDSDT